MFKINIPNVLASVYASLNHTHGNLTNDGKVGSTANKPLITGTNGVVTAGSYEATASNIKMNGTANVGSLNTFARGDHVHPTDTSRAASSHAHGNITTDGKVGTATGKPLITTTNGVVTAGSFGSSTSTSATEFVACNDSRLSDTRTPKAHEQSVTTITNSETYSNLGSNLTTQKLINDAINTKIGALLAVDLVTVVSSLGTASASTMNKLYLVAESSSKTNDAYEIYVTVRTGSSGNYSYAWEKVDTARIDLSGYSTTSHTHGNITKDGKVGTTANKPLITTTNGTVTTGSFGSSTSTSATEFVACSDSRLSDTRTPKSHTHGNVTNDGKVGTTANKPLITTTGGAVTTGSFGSSTSTSSTEFVACNDSRLSDARTPTTHNQAATTITNDQKYNNIKAGESTTLTLTTQKLINDAINTKLGNKVDVDGDKGLSSNDFTDTYKGYVDNLVSSTATTKNAHVHGNITSDGKVGTATGKPLITTTGGAVTTGSFGSSTSTSATEFVSCSDSRLSDARTPTSHTHGNVTNDGKVGTAAGKPLITGTNGVVTAGSFGSSTSTSATEFVACNDSRLTNSRTPTSHTHGNLQNTGQIGSTAVANGIAVTDSSGKITVTKGSTANTTSAPQLYYYNGVLTIGG